MFALLPVALAGVDVRAQAVPAGGNTAPVDLGFQMPNVGGTLSYSVSASESITTGLSGYSGSLSSTNLVGNLAYLSSSVSHPFSAVYSGGYLFSTSSQPSAPFQNLALSQVAKTKNWNFTLADSVSYLPESPVGGLSGIAGLGDLGLDPVQLGLENAQGILTPYETRVSNTISGTLARSLTGKTSIQGTGGYSMLRFLGSAVGVDGDTISGGGGISHHIDGRNTVSANYVYSDFTYLNTKYEITTQSAVLEFSRQVSRRLSIDLAAGPQRVAGSIASLTAPSTNVTASASLTFAEPATSYILSYGRGVNAGAGVIQGTRTDSATFSAHHAFGRNWGASGFGSFGYAQTLPNSLLPAFSARTFTGGVQGSRRLSRSLSAFGSYTVEKQDLTNGSVAPQALNGVTQTIGFGITYSPGPISVR